MEVNSIESEQAILSSAQMRLADQQTIQNGLSGFQLLSAAGQQVFGVVQDLVSSSDRILVACGSGNNGGDGLIAAKLLIDAGYDVTVALLGNPADLQGDARTALELLNNPTCNLTETHADRFTIIVDAILGIGIDRAITGELARWITSANRSNALIISVDIPTGINGDSGAVLGVCIEAQHTVSFFRKKPAHVLYPGRFYCGQLSIKHIGIDAQTLGQIQPSLHENAIALWQDKLPVLDWGSHKYKRGHTVVASGDRTSTGASRLAAHAALRTGAGLVTLAIPVDAIEVVAAHVTCEMLKRIDSADDFGSMLSDERINVVVLGPGMGIGQHTREMVTVAINSTASVVLDADALTSFENHQEQLFQLILQSKGQVVMTPHTGEFKRLFGDSLESTDSNTTGSTTVPSANDRVRMCQAAARIASATVVLKGSDTVISNSSGQCVVNTNAPPWLATAGSGDVLAGTIAGWLAQGINGFDSACVACWMHGEAAQAIGPGLIASDIAEHYPAIHQRLFKIRNTP